MEQEIRNSDTGLWQITTATGSKYLLDMDARNVTRRMAANAPIVAFLKVGFAELRRDGESLDLLMLEKCKIGEPAQMFIQVRDDHIPTLRTTSPVMFIGRLDK